MPINLPKRLADIAFGPRRLLLVKLAGIGDVAMACRALNETLINSKGKLHLHWIIDRSYVSLAQKLLKLPQDVTLNFHPVNSSLIFQGDRTQKAKEGLRVLRAVTKVLPHSVALLHRDWRYVAFIRPGFAGSLVRVTRKPMHEVDAYKIALNRALVGMGVNLGSDSIRTEPKTHVPTHRIGILIGGAQNSKITYSEKRWPHIPALVTSILKENKKVILFGSAQDELAKADLLELVPPSLQSGITDLVGKTRLDELPGLLAELDCLISIDSGIVHIASMCMSDAGQKIVGIYGPTDPKVWGPLATGGCNVRVLRINAACSPCYLNDGVFVPCRFTGEQFGFCMKEISSLQVLHEIFN